MNKNKSRSGVLSTIIVTAVLIILLNVCTFVIPFNKTNMVAHFITYGCTEVVIISEMILIISQLFLGEDSKQKVLGLPIIYFGCVTVGIQLLAAVIFYLVNVYIALPAWIIIVVECFIIGSGIIQIVKGFFFKNRNKEYFENKGNTKFMNEFRARLKTLSKINKIEGIDKKLNDLLDIALGSDPITNEKTIDSETELLSLLQELDESIKDGSEENALIVIEKTKNTLLERNVLCKTGK